MAEPLRVLIAEDSPRDAELLVRELRHAGFEPEWQRVDTEEDYLLALGNAPDLVLSDFSMPQFSAQRALQLLQERKLDIPFLIVSGSIGEDTAVAAMKDGAADYLLKDRLSRLGPAVRRALEQRGHRRERHRADQEVIEWKNRYEAAIDASGQILYDWDPRTDDLTFGGSLHRTLGYTAEELGGGLSTWVELIHSEDAPAYREERERATWSREPFHLEYRLRRKDGGFVAVEDRGYFFLDAGGRLVRMVGFVVDVTERKQAEQSIRIQAHMLDEIGQAVIGSDPDGKVMYANRFAEELYGWPRGEMVGRHILDVTVPDEQRAQAVELLRDVGQGRSWSGEFLVKDREGRIFPAFVTTTALLDNRSRLTGFIGVSTDISARKRGEHQRAARHALTKALAESATLTSAAPGIIRAVCEAVEGQFGALWEIDRGANLLRCAATWQAAEVMSKTLEDETRAVTFAPGESLAGRVWVGGKAALIPDVGQDAKFVGTQLVARAGMRCAYALPILVSGQVTGVVSALGREVRAPEPELLEMLDGVGTQVGQFIELRETERQLLQAQKMEAVGQLAGGIAHDFNNLLGVILGYADLAARELGPEHRTQRRLEAIGKAAERAAGLTRQILTFSRKQAVEMRVLDLNRVVEDMEKMLRRLIGEDVRLVVALGQRLGRVRADPGQIEQVIMNLAVNARDAMPTGGRLVIDTANTDLDEHYVRSHPEAHPGPYVMLAVGDTGHGMDRETQARIFEPFFTTKDPGKGTGLGLAVVYGIVKQSGGSLSVYSEPGSGSTFKVYLPRAEADASVVAEAGLAPAVGGSETLLLVEDEEALRAIVAETLRVGGYTVIEAADPESALIAAAQSDRRIHLVLTDVVLPGQSGPQTVALIRNAHPDVRVLLMSGYTDRLVGGTHGVDPLLPFISKPFTVEALLRKVREVLDLRPPA